MADTTFERLMEDAKNKGWEKYDTVEFFLLEDDVSNKAKKLRVHDLQVIAERGAVKIMLRKKYE